MTWAILDDHNILRGFSDNSVDGAIDVGPEGCDLEPGHYYWDEERGCFLPCDYVAPEELRMSAELALAKLLEHLMANGSAKLKSEMPPECRKWLEQFQETLDAVGSSK